MRLLMCIVGVCGRCELERRKCIMMWWITCTLSIVCVVQGLQGGLESGDNDDWVAFEENHYLFIIDAERETDQTLPGAHANCRAKHARLISIETFEEMSFIKRQIRARQDEIGHKSAHDQWWTSGIAYHGSWVWNNGHHSPITVSELKRVALPVRKTLHQLALRQSEQGWRLRTLPENYKLRYICERAILISHNLVRTTEEKLVDKLFFNYDVDVRGVAQASDALSVNIAFSLVRIQDLDERKQVLTAVGLVVSEWVDLRLKWDPARFNNVTSLAVHSSRIWLPQLTIMNGVEEQIIHQFEHKRAVVSPSGLVHWEPGGVFQTTCDMDMTYFPFDTQTCTVRVGTWVYHSLQINLSTETADIDLSDFHLNGEWELIKTSSAWNRTVLPRCESLAYSHINFIMHLQRRRVYYVINIIVPFSLLTLLMLVMFWVPQHGRERVAGILTILLAFTVFLHMVSNSVPWTSLQIPIIVIYSACIMSLGTITVCLTIALMHLYRNCPASSPPSCTLPWIHARLDSYYRIHKERLKTAMATDSEEKKGKKCHLQNSIEGETRYVTPNVTPPKRPDPFDGEGVRKTLRYKDGQRSTNLEGLTDESAISSQNTPVHCSEIPALYTRSPRMRFHEPRLHKRDQILKLSVDGESTDVSKSSSRIANEDDDLTNKDTSTYNRREEWQEFVRLLDKIYSLIVSIAMLATALFLFLMPLYDDSNV